MSWVWQLPKVHGCCTAFWLQCHTLCLALQPYVCVNIPLSACLGEAQGVLVCLYAGLLVAQLLDGRLHVLERHELRAVTRRSSC